MASKSTDQNAKPKKDEDADELATLDALEKEASEFSKVPEAPSAPPSHNLTSGRMPR